MFPVYDVIVVGAGHAGCEAAAAAANMGSKVLLITMNMNTIAQMSCNPAMGGVAKGQIIREIDALGGYSGVVSDKSMIQFKMLNKSKGPAMWSPRSQNDRMHFAEEWRLILERIPNVDFWQETVTGITIKDNRATGVRTGMGIDISSKSVVLTNGTFLNGIIHIGKKKFGGGRTGEKTTVGITEQLIELGFESGRMKTGTPPRIDGRSLDYSKMEEQAGDEVPEKFSYTNTRTLKKQKSCHITYTNEKVHDTLRTGFKHSPVFTGQIKGAGPRYCPSIEDKINRFTDKNRHQIFVEPEGWNTIEIYVNGFSTSLPENIQNKAMRLIPGFKNAKMFRPGYAIEYDFFAPTQLKPTLETKLIENLYFAGQINGTTGYEEAACQGLIAGINVHNKIKEKDPLVLSRSEAYIGVLIDDLINKGTEEPYRMFTSRAEFRILLRQDNADLRLTKTGHKIGLASQERLDAVNQKISNTKVIVDSLLKTKVQPEHINAQLKNMNTAEIREKINLHQLLKRPEIDIVHLQQLSNDFKKLTNRFSSEELQQASIQIKYKNYIEKEKNMAKRLSDLDNKKIPSQFNYYAIPALSVEAREKLIKINPENLGQASRISGVKPTDISILMVHIAR